MVRIVYPHDSSSLGLDAKRRCDQFERDGRDGTDGGDGGDGKDGEAIHRTAGQGRKTLMNPSAISQTPSSSTRQILAPPEVVGIQIKDRNGVVQTVSLEEFKSITAERHELARLQGGPRGRTINKRRITALPPKLVAHPAASVFKDDAEDDTMEMTDSEDEPSSVSGPSSSQTVTPVENSVRIAYSPRARSALKRDRSSSLGPSTSPTRRRSYGGYGPAQTCVEEDLTRKNVFINIEDHKHGFSFRMDDEKRKTQAFYTLADGLGQTSLKRILKIWIKIVEPNKQSRYPYNGGRRRRGSHSSSTSPETPDIPSPPPPWWPTYCRHKEPDHGSKHERTLLAVKVLRLSQEKGPYLVQRLEEKTRDKNLLYYENTNSGFADASVERRQRLLRQLFRLASEEEDFVSGGCDGDQIFTLPYEPPVPRGPRAPARPRQSRRSAGTKRTRQAVTLSVDHAIPTTPEPQAQTSQSFTLAAQNAEYVPLRPDCTIENMTFAQDNAYRTRFTPIPVSQVDSLHTFTEPSFVTSSGVRSEFSTQFSEQHVLSPQSFTMSTQGMSLSQPYDYSMSASHNPHYRLQHVEPIFHNLSLASPRATVPISTSSYVPSTFAVGETQSLSFHDSDPPY